MNLQLYKLDSVQDKLTFKLIITDKLQLLEGTLCTRFTYITTIFIVTKDFRFFDSTSIIIDINRNTKNHRATITYIFTVNLGYCSIP